MKFPELVSENKHLDNLCYLRELYKLNIDNWVESKQDGTLVDDEYVIEQLEILTLIEDGISGLHSKIQLIERMNEKGLKEKVDALILKTTNLEHQQRKLECNFITNEWKKKIGADNGTEY